MLPHRKRISTWYFLLGLAIVHCVRGLPEIIRIGGLFGKDEDDKLAENALRFAVNRINRNKTLLTGFRLTQDIQHVRDHNSFQASKKVCNQVQKGIACLIGPDDTYVAHHVNSLCNALDIPFIEIRENMVDVNRRVNSISLYPNSSTLSQLYLDLLAYYKWDDFVLLYGDQDRLIRLQDLFSDPIKRKHEITIRHVDKYNLRNMVKSIKGEHNKRGHHHIFVDLDLETTELLLRYALQAGMIDAQHHFIFVNPDLHVLDLEDYRYNYVNITGIRMIRADEQDVRSTMAAMAAYETRKKMPILNGSSTILLKTALAYDAVNVIANALHALNRSTDISLSNLSCTNPDSWALGSSFYNQLRMTSINGLTGPIQFDNDMSSRNNTHIDVLHLNETGLNKVGWWSPETGVNITETYSAAKKPSITGNGTLIVTSRLEVPYVVAKKQDPKGEPLVGNDRYEGFCIDLLKEIAAIVGFQYEIKLVQDGQYGILNKSGQWTGMVRELIDGEADLAVASLTISYQREQAIDFTKPFLNLGISILFKVPKSETPGIFSFLNPLAVEIWLYILLAYIAVSFTMYILARFSPYEWYNPHPCNPDTDVVENAFDLSNSCWFTVGTLMQQGSDINPRAMSTRIVGSIWWFFTLIIISSYTANLAAFLTVERMESPIESADDLAKQTEISYGTLEGGSTKTFFKESKIPTYQKMWAFMENKKPSVFTKETETGIERVKEGNYAYLMESTMLDYAIHRDCELMQVGGLLDSKGYGIGTPIGSPWRDPISMAILELQESGKIQMHYNRWWKNTGTCNRENKKDQSKASALGLENIGGIFVCLLGGLAFSVLVAFLEFIWNSKKNAKTDKQSLCSEMGEELRFAIKCGGSNKRPAFKRNCSTCKKPHPHNHNHNGDLNNRRNSHLSIHLPDIDSNGHIHMRDTHRRSPGVTDRDGYLYVPEKDGYCSDHHCSEKGHT